MCARIIVRERGTLKPLRNIRVKVYDTNGNLIDDDTDLRGVAEFPTLVDDIYIIHIEPPEHRPYHTKTFINRESTIDIRLDPAIV